MTKPALRFVVLGVLAAGMALGFGQRLVDPPLTVLAQATEQFLPAVPPKVYSGVDSHAPLVIPDDPGNSGTPEEPADADPTLGLNGYCVDVNGEGHSAIGGDRGFTVVNGVVVDTDFFDNGSGTTTDDVYCAVVRADRIIDELPRPDMIVRWSYLDGGAVATAELAIEVVTVTLIGFDGYTGIPATVCTEGWDPAFLTGFTANNPPANIDDPDEVVAADWSTNPSSPPDVLTPYHPDAGPEWCANLSSNAALTGVDVTLTLWALYNLGIDTDDVLVTETVEDLVDFVAIPRPELRHITVVTPGGEGGQVDNRRAANPNVIGAIHTACVLPSVPADQLSPDDIQFISPNGALPTLVQVFTNDGAIVPGVPAGTKCFNWTSVTPGSQEVYATVNIDVSNPLPATGPTFVSWDSNLDGNDGRGPGSGLLKHWNVIDHTVINRGGSWFQEENELTNSTVTLPIAFNVLDGTYVASINLTEWVIGTRPGPNGSDGEPIDGVPVRLEIISACGYFGGGPTMPTVLESVTRAGRVEFTINILRDPGCNQSSAIQLRVTASYPPLITQHPVVEVETLTILLRFVAAESSPIIAWAGSVVTLNYGFGGECDEQPVYWARESGFGAFLADGLEDDPDFAQSTLEDCESTIQFGSAQHGEVVIVATLAGNQFSKVEFFIFFLAFEDLTLSVSEPDPNVSERISVNVNVRGYFVGANPSGRPAEIKEDGRAVPQDRWVLPDDWATLKGPEDFRPGWPGSPSLPPAPVTFFMESEGIANSFQGGVKDGATGYFVVAANTFDENISPVTRVPSRLGSLNDSDAPVEYVLLHRPRIISTNTNGGGSASAGVFGDFNLSFEECVKNLPTGNPHCEVGDIVGRTAFFAVVDYPQSQIEPRGKYPPIRSNNAAAAFHWAGYKRVTWEPGGTPDIRYVVAHLKDRDGFCDAINFNNTLGVRVEFAIDSKDGIIYTAADRPFTINTGGNRHFATVTTFDTLDDSGAPMNISIAKIVQTDDECQAWIRIDNSLGQPVNVTVTFSAPPAPVPGDLRITDMNCTTGFGFVEITNAGSNEVSLAGFALRSGKSGSATGFVDEEHFGLEGHLLPGERILIPGDTTLRPWQGSSGDAFVGDNDYARLVWEERTLVFRGCNGFEYVADDVDLFPDGEGEIVVDIIVPFRTQDAIRIVPGWNLVPIMGGNIPLEDALGANADAVTAIYTYDDEYDGWRRYIPGLPDQAITITELQDGKVYWVLANRPFTLIVPR